MIVDAQPLTCPPNRGKLTLFHLAERRHLRSIIQIAFLTLDDAPVLIESELGSTEVDPRILNHFRSVNRISKLLGPGVPHLRVFDQKFSAQSRADYLHAAIAAINDLRPRPAAVFLDPDTGLAEKPGSSKHITPSELREVWSALLPSDWIVLYQHASRQPGWMEARRSSFQKALSGVPVVTFCSPNGARDVVFFAAWKLGAHLES